MVNDVQTNESLKKTTESFVVIMITKLLRKCFFKKKRGIYPTSEQLNIQFRKMNRARYSAELGIVFGLRFLRRTEGQIEKVAKE